MICRCPDCAAQPGGSREFSCTQFEQHGGSGTAKKWKASLKIVPGSTPDVPAGEVSPFPFPQKIQNGFNSLINADTFAKTNMTQRC